MLARALERAGADILELGVPFTDPIADGPTNQRAAERALARGRRSPSVLAIVRELRYSSELPVVLFSYFNPVHAYGLARFAVDAAAAGVDGVLFTDVPVEEAGAALGGAAPGRHRAGAAAGADLDAGARQGGAEAGGRASSTSSPAPASPAPVPPWRRGSRTQVRMVRKLTRTPGGGRLRRLDPRAGAAASRSFADGVVVGSALVERIGELGDAPELPGEVEALARSFALATRRK